GVSRTPAFRGASASPPAQFRRNNRPAKGFAYAPERDRQVRDAQNRGAIPLRRRHAPLFNENSRRPARRNSFHSRRTPRHDLFFIAIGLSAAMHFLPDGTTRPVAFTHR